MWRCLKDTNIFFVTKCLHYLIFFQVQIIITTQKAEIGLSLSSIPPDPPAIKSGPSKLNWLALGIRSENMTSSMECITQIWVSHITASADQRSCSYLEISTAGLRCTVAILWGCYYWSNSFLNRNLLLGVFANGRYDRDTQDTVKEEWYQRNRGRLCG